MNFALVQLIQDSQNVHTGMASNEANSQYAVWKAKPVLDSRQLFALDSLDGLTHEGMGIMEISADLPYEGKPTLHLGGSNSDKNPGKRVVSWGGGANTVHFQTGNTDLSAYTRLSLWCYSKTTRPNSWLYLILCNGDTEAGSMKGLDSRTGFNVPTGQWHQLIWEFHSHDRSAVREFVLSHDPEGTLSEDDDRYDLYFADLRVETVEPDYVYGWELGDRIAYNQIGYLPDAPKRAATQGVKGKTFTVRNAKTMAVAYTGQAETIQVDIGTYQILDFSTLQSTGEYMLEIAGRQTHSFPIGSDVLTSPVWKSINFFQRERCGCEVHGLHSPCGMTDFIEHPDGKHRLNAAGGWHDAGDLIQELCTTADGITSMLDMAEHLGDKDVQLRDRVLEEAKYGLEYVLKTSFGDGYYAFESGHFHWDNDVLEEVQDPAGRFHRRQAVNASLGNWFRAGAEAQGYLSFQNMNPRFARRCLTFAEADFGFALDNEPAWMPTMRWGNTAAHELQTLSRKGYSAIMLYRATGKQSYLDIAAETAKMVLNCQQTELPDWEIPLRGFFWCEQTHENIAAYEHQSAEQAPIVLLVRLLEVAAAHPDATAWRQGCQGNQTWAVAYDELVMAIKAEVDPAKRAELCAQAEEILMATGAVAPLYYNTNPYMLKPNVSNLIMLSTGDVIWTYAEIGNAKK